MIKVQINIDDHVAEDTGTLAKNTPLKERIIHALKQVHDPEIPLNVYDLGLIYKLEISKDSIVNVNMTLTAPNCPMAEQIIADIQTAIQNTQGVKETKINLVWVPKWTKERMSDAAKLELGLF